MPSAFVKKNGEISVYRKKSGNREGRPSRFTEDLQSLAVHLSQIGLNNHEIAQDLDIPWGTFGTWLKKFPEFSIRLDENRNLLLKNSQKALGLRIAGYSYKETKVTKTQVMQKDENGKMVPTGAIKVKTEISETHSPPDVKAAMYVLDRRSKYYRRKPEDVDDVKQEPITVVVNEIKPPKKKNES